MNALHEYLHHNAEHTSNESITLLNFTMIWKEIYDDDNMTLSDIIADLNLTSTIVVDLKEWFSFFFGIEGVVTLDRVEPSIPPVSGGGDGQPSDIPPGMEAIVEWITVQVQKEV